MQWLKVVFAVARNDTWTQPELVPVLCAAAAIGVVLAYLVLGFREVEAPPARLLDPAAGDDAERGGSRFAQRDAGGAAAATMALRAPAARPS